MEEAYKNREIDERFANLSTLIREKHDDIMYKMSEVVVQTTKTNGRVRWLEKMIYLAIGGLGVISIVIFPLLLTLIQTGKL